MKTPLSKFIGFLKQVDRQAIGIAEQIILDNAFPSFWPASPDDETIQAQKRLLRKQQVDFIFQDLNPPRRLSGCWSLPRARYFSLCHDESGDDSNTLANELNAYLDPLRAGLLMFADMAAPEAAMQAGKRFGINLNAGKYILVILIGRPGAISPVIDALAASGVLADAGEKQRRDYWLAAFQIPYMVTRREIDGVIDLRSLDCQKFVVEEFFKKDTPAFSKAERGGIDRFVNCLPILMAQELGGGSPADGAGGIMQSLAGFLRARGAQALIYPSARSDVLTENRGGKLTTWRGWCLVDYRGASEPLVGGYYDLSRGWPSMFPKGAAVRAATKGEYAGSFEVTGIEDWIRQRITERESLFVRSQSGGSKDATPR